MPDSFNKGEWSEFYTFVKILADGLVYAADERLNRIEEIYYPVIGVLREEDNALKDYMLESTDTISIKSDDKTLVKKVSRQTIRNAVGPLFAGIKEGKGASFEVPLSEKLKDELSCKKIKADSRNKEDITLESDSLIRPCV